MGQQDRLSHASHEHGLIILEKRIKMDPISPYETIPSCGPFMQDENGKWQPVPDLMTEDELIRYLRIPEVSKAQDYHNVIANLMRMRDLPCLHISRQPLFPLQRVRQWILEQSV